MSWLISILTAIGLALGGTLFGGYLASHVIRWRRVSKREGYAGYWLVFMALLAGLFSLASGLLMARYSGIENGFLAILAAAGVAFGGIGLVALLGWITADRAPRQDGKELAYDLEIRAPAGATTISRESGQFYAYLSADGAPMTSATLEFDRLRELEGRWLLPGRVKLETGRPGLYVALGGQRLQSATVYFRLPPSATPDEATGEWSPWLQGTPSGGAEAGSDAAAFEVRVCLRKA